MIKGFFVKNVKFLQTYISSYQINHALSLIFIHSVIALQCFCIWVNDHHHHDDDYICWPVLERRRAGKRSSPACSPCKALNRYPKIGLGFTSSWQTQKREAKRHNSKFQIPGLERRREEGKRSSPACSPLASSSIALTLFQDGGKSESFS